MINSRSAAAQRCAATCAAFGCGLGCDLQTIKALARAHSGFEALVPRFLHLQH
jgi:hypothetical protein